MGLASDLTLTPIEADNACAALLEALDGLSVEECARFNARLILILMNQINDIDTLLDAIKAAQDASPGAPE